MKIEIYSDVACPWCYIGEARFGKALDAFGSGEEVDVIYRPYQLDPNAPAEGVPMLDYLEGRFGGDARSMADRVSEAGRSEGLTMDYDRGIAVNTLRAHRLMWLAATERGADAQRDVAHRLFRAHFSDGSDIGDLDVLVDIGTAAGLEAERVREFMASAEGEVEVREQIETAKQIGISAVPTFVINGRYAVQGAQPAAQFAEVLEKVAAEEGAG